MGVYMRCPNGYGRCENMYEGRKGCCLTLTLDREAVRRPPADPVEQHAKAVREMVAETNKDMVELPAHYARFKIEPIKFIGENKLDWWQGNIVKYVCRHDAKNGIEDIDKVIQYAIRYRRYLLGDPNWAVPKPGDDQWWRKESKEDHANQTK
jgi:hypothetical protein